MSGRQSDKSEKDLTDWIRPTLTRGRKGKLLRRAVQREKKKEAVLLEESYRGRLQREQTRHRKTERTRG